LPVTSKRRRAVPLPIFAHFAEVNAVMQSFFQAPYPARSTVGVAALPRGALFEVEAVMVLPG
jgi:enamine deaminase RidA (YjgF/YER057c/UK114 family)